MQAISKNSLVFTLNFYKVRLVMDSLAFWLPLIFLFVSALMGTALKRRARDHCLTKFHGTQIILSDLNGDWHAGVVNVFAQGIELVFAEPREDNLGPVRSLVIHPNEVDKIPFFIRPAPQADTRAGVIWEKELARIRTPSFSDRVFRLVLNFYNMLRDAFGQAAQTIMGAISKDSSVGKVKNADKRMNEIGSGITDLVPNAWEPILEKYRGQRVIIEHKTTDGKLCEAGVLEDYSSKYLLLRQVSVQNENLRKSIEARVKKAGNSYDVLFSRNSTVVRNTLSN